MAGHDRPAQRGKPEMARPASGFHAPPRWVLPRCLRAAQPRSATQSPAQFQRAGCLAGRWIHSLSFGSFPVRTACRRSGSGYYSEVCADTTTDGKCYDDDGRAVTSHSYLCFEGNAAERPQRGTAPPASNKPIDGLLVEPRIYCSSGYHAMHLSRQHLAPLCYHCPSDSMESTRGGRRSRLISTICCCYTSCRVTISFSFISSPRPPLALEESFVIALGPLARQPTAGQNSSAALATFLCEIRYYERTAGSSLGPVSIVASGSSKGKSL